MNPQTLLAAKQFLRDAYEADHNKAPTDEELVEWALAQWNQVRQLVPSPSEALKELSDTTTYPGLNKRKGGA